MSTRKDAVVVGPPSAGAYLERPLRPDGPTTFRRTHQRGNIPVVMEHNPGLHRIRWLEDIETLDLAHFLPLFFDGMLETDHPYSLYARQGVQQLMDRVGATELAALLPELISPIRNALDTRNHVIMCDMIKLVQRMVKVGGDEVGRALVPYYRQILPVFSLYRNHNVNLGDGVEYGQRRRENLGDLIQETLEMFELSGGDEAFINIKNMIPDYHTVK
ncbi:parkin coregulated gene protein-like [Diretmus argenteus]